jgi:ankyrin repeat protein
MSSLNKQLLKAAHDGELVDVKRLVHDEGADVNFQSVYGSVPLHCASMHGHTEVVRFLIENRVDVDCEDMYGYKALHSAAVNSHTEVLRFLIENEADVHCKYPHRPWS